MTAAEHLDLASEFPAASRELWLAAVRGVLLKGRPDATDDDFAAAFDRQLVHRTEDGIALQPLYTADDAVADPGLPGRAPFVRGSRPTTGDWEVRQRVWPGVDGSSARYELDHGATGVLLALGDEPVDVDRLDHLLDGVLLDLAPVSLDAPDGSAVPGHALLDLWDHRSTPAGQRRGSLGADPLGAHARAGGATDLDAGIAAAAALASDTAARAPEAQAVVVDGTVWHEAGATDAQELAWTTAAGATYVRALVAAGLPVDVALGQLEFRFAATADQFATIAKLRAARRVWARVAEVAGASPDAPGQRQHADASRAMLTRYDPWVNTLRSTVACFAAGTGGAAAVTTSPHDVLLVPGGSPLGRRIARNTQSILLAESNLARVADPAGGSWYVEHLTDDLAVAAWAGVQEVERAGGIAAALAAGLVAERLDVAVADREKALATRRRPLTGLSEFPDIGEPSPPRLEAPDRPSGTPFPPLVPRRLSDGFETQRARADRHLATTGDRPLVRLATLGDAAAHTARLTFAKNLFEVAGIRTEEGTVDAVAAAGPGVVCLCSSDGRYRDEGEAAVAALRDAGATRVYLAGRRLDIPGVDEEVGVGSDVLDVLTRALDHLGVAP